MGRLGEKNTFVDEVYNEFLDLDYDVTYTDLNPKRDNKEKMDKAEDVLSKLYGIVETEYKEVSERYNIESIEEIKKELTNSGEINSVQMTLQEELLQIRLGGSLANFGFLIDGNELPIEKDIQEMMLNLLIIEHYFGKSKEEEEKEKEKDKTKGGGGGSGGGSTPPGPPPGGGSGGGNTPPGPPPGGDSGGGSTPPGPPPGGGGGTGGGTGGGDDDEEPPSDGEPGDITDGEPKGDTEPPTTPDPDAEGDDTPPSEEDKVDDVDPVNDYDNDDANPYKISCWICNDENGKKPTFSAKLTPEELQRLKEMGIGVERTSNARSATDDATETLTLTRTETETETPPETSFSPKEMADCAKYDLQILRIILVVCKMIKVLTLILDPIYAITTQIIELAALACGCWSSPANVSEIVQRLIQVVISAATNAVSTLIDKLWKMLGLNCLTETSIDLINKIQNALTGLGKINQSVVATANKFVKTADNIYQDSAQVIEAWNNAKSQFLAKRENDFKSLFNKEAMFGSEGFLQDFKNTLWDNTSTNGWLTGPAASILGNSQVAKDIKDVKKLVESEIEKNRDGKQIKETFGKETQRWSELSEYFMKNTHFSETNDAWSEGVANFWNWERTNEDGTKDNPSAGEILLNGFGMYTGSSSSATTSGTGSSSSQSKVSAKSQVNNLTAEQESNETPAKSVDNINEPK